MSKTTEDYREIVKVLKLQLLKVREENNSLSKTLGIASQTETSCTDYPQYSLHAPSREIQE